MIKLIAFDLDGTLTQHKTPIEPENYEVLQRLSKKYRLVMVGAGQSSRIFKQLQNFPIDIIGNYGLQYSEYDFSSGELRTVRDETLPCDRGSVAKRVEALREKHGYTKYEGSSVEFHPSGCVTIPLIGTAANIKDKLAFDPTKVKRLNIYSEVKATFPEYRVFVGGTSSFDMVPSPYGKYYALDLYCREKGISHSEVVFVGDDYRQGGNDEDVYLSDFEFIKIESYRDFPRLMKNLL